MPSPAFVGASSYRSNGATSLSRTSASIGASEGDVLIAVVRTVGNKTLTLDSGWTAIPGASQYWSGQRTSAYVRVATASEPSSYTFSWTGSANAALGIVAYSGADGTPDVAAITTGADSPTVTTTADDARVIVAATASYDDGAFGFSHPSGTTERTETSDAWEGLAIADYEHATAGATGVKSWSIWDANDWQALTIALVPPPSGPPAGPQYEAKSTTGEQYDGATNGFTPAIPAGTEDGDLLVACCWGNGVEIDTAPTGWTQALAIDNGSVYMNVFTKTASDSESSPTFTASYDSYGEVILYRISGADTLTPIDVVGTASGSLDAPSVTTNVDDCWVLHLFGSASGSGSSITVPSGDTAIDTPSNFYVTLASGYTSQASAGATGAASFDDGAVTSDQITATIAVAPQSLVPDPVGSASVAGNASSLSVSSAAIGASSGDLLIAAVRLAPYSYAVTPPAGWSAIPGGEVDQGSGPRTRLYQHVATDTEPTDYTFSWVSATDACLGIVAYSGVADTIDDVAEVGGSLTSPSVTTTRDEARVVVISAATNAGTVEFTEPAGTTLRTELQDTAQALAIADFVQDSAGSTAGQTWSCIDYSDPHALTVALLPRLLASGHVLSVAPLGQMGEPGLLAPGSTMNVAAIGQMGDPSLLAASHTMSVSSPAPMVDPALLSPGSTMNVAAIGQMVDPALLAPGHVMAVTPPGALLNPDLLAPGSTMTVAPLGQMGDPALLAPGNTMSVATLGQLGSTLATAPAMTVAALGQMVDPALLASGHVMAVAPPSYLLGAGDLVPLSAMTVAALGQMRDPGLLAPGSTVTVATLGPNVAALVTPLAMTTTALGVMGDPGLLARGNVMQVPTPQRIIPTQRKGITLASWTVHRASLTGFKQEV
ncbi:MAG: hypothetical protein ACYTGL_14760 [Planctomycetota bacterium]|jgi:hypothetical protein